MKKSHLNKTILFLLISIISLSLCFCSFSQTQNYGVPEKLDDGWETASLQSVGIHSDKIFRLTKQVDEGRYQGQRSLVIVKDGKLVHEAYFDGYEREDLHRIYSVSKSVTSILVGIAIDKGFIHDVSEPLRNLLPEYAEIMNEEEKKEITLKHVLTMSPGFDWHEEDFSYGDPRNSHHQMDSKHNWLEFVLSRPMAFQPGTRWVYNTGNTHLLGGIIKENTRLHANEFADKYLFEPLEIKKYKWNTDPMGYPCVGGSNGGLGLTARNLAKIGQMALNKGMWKGKQIVSQEWIEESTKIHINATNISKYGYQWWRDSYKIKGKKYKAICGYGYGGQSVQIFPELEMVIVMTSWGRQPRAETLPVLLRILNAAVESES
jgi:CubicO group peptidase (beta-lactamase class C family)